MTDEPWEEPYQDIESCTYADLEGTDLIAAGRDSKIDDPETHVGQGDVWFRVPDQGFAGLWRPPNRNQHFRFAPCFVHPDHRGKAIGKALVLARFFYAQDHADITSMDTYAHNRRLFERLGFQYQESYEMGTHYLTYEKE